VRSSESGANPHSVKTQTGPETLVTNVGYGPRFVNDVEENLRFFTEWGLVIDGGRLWLISP
jgi:hypothetical protein